MGVTHRVLYVGIGGTGVQIGKELEVALRRDLCGPDGKELLRKGGAFQNLEPYQLPDYIQSLYFDFDDDAEQILQQGTDLSTSLVRKNSTIVKSIHATGATSYRSTAEMLRSDKSTSKMVNYWLPEKENEPQVAPLADGAGQYPTVGRAALYLALKRSGNDIEREIDEAIKRLVLSGGMLQSMKNESDKPKVLCYVGFSVAGGTGTGIFYDIIHLLENRLNKVLKGIEVSIFPLTLLPSAFIENWKPNNIKAGKANAAIALKDLAQLIEHLQKDDEPDVFSVSYPEPFGKLNMTPATIPSAFLFSKPVSVSQDDMYKSMASFVMSQITTGESLKEDSESKNLESSKTEMSIFSKIINDKSETAKPDEYGPGLRPFSPAISGSLSIPLENISDLISRKLISEYFEENKSASIVQSENNANDMAEVLKNMDLNFIVDPAPSKPKELLNEEERIIASRGKQLHENISYYQNQVYRWIDGFSNMARKAITDASMDWNQEVLRLLGNESILKIIRIFKGSNLNQDPHSKEGVVGKLENFSSKIEKRQPVPEFVSLKGPKFIQSGDHPRVKTEYLKQSVPAWYKRQFRIIWQDSWTLQRSSWQHLIDDIQINFANVESGFNQFTKNINEIWEAKKSEVQKKEHLVTGFLPIANGNLDSLKNELIRSLSETPSTQSTPSITEMFSKVLPKTIWQDAWKAYLQKSSENIHEATNEFLNYLKIELKQLVIDELQKASTDGTSLLPSLKNLLIKASKTTTGNSQDQIKLLQSKLGEIIPLDALPDNGPGTPITEIWVNYPLDDHDELVESYLRKHITADWRNQNELMNKIKFYPVGGETIFVSIYNFANGLFSLNEPKQLFKELFELKNTPEGRELQWRQRLSTDTVYNIASRRDFVSAIQYFLVAAWNDKVVIENGENINNAKQVSIRLPNEGKIELNLKRFKNFSTVSDLPDAFKDFWINMSLEDSSNWDQLINMMPNGAEEGDLEDFFPKTNVFSEILNNIDSQEIQELKEIVKNSKYEVEAAPGVLAKAKLKLQFWTELLPAALNKTIGAGTYNKLSQLANELENRNLLHKERIGG